MYKRSFILPFFLLSLLQFNAFSQPNKNGVPIITNYEHFTTGGSEQNWSITQDERGVMYFGNQDKGVLEYDGVEWRSIPISNNSTVRSLTTGDDGIIYVGAVNEFGYLAPDCYGNMNYKSLIGKIPLQDSLRITISDVWKTYYSKGIVYFCTRSSIFEYIPASDSINVLDIPEWALFTYIIDDVIYTGTYSDGIMKLENDSFVHVPGWEFFVEKNVSGLVRFDSTRFLVATFFHGLFLLDINTGKIDRNFINKGLNEYLKEGQVVNAQSLNEDFVVADFYNGVTIINRDGNAIEIITKAEGIQDQQVPFVYSNKQMKGSAPVWIANFQGVSKIETNNPFRIFTEDAGFEGFISDITYFNDRLYISTSNGLYYKTSSSTGTEFLNVSEEIQEQIWRLHHLTTDNGEEFLLAVTNSSSTIVIDKQHSIKHLSNLIDLKQDDSEADITYSGFSITQDPINQNTVFIGGNVDVYGITYSNGKWQETYDLDGLPPEQRSIIVDKYNNLWSASVYGGITKSSLSMENDKGAKRIYTLDDGLPANEKNHLYLDPESEEVLFGTTNGYYRYDYKNDTIYRDSIFNKLLPEGKNTMMSLYKDYEDDIWISFENEYQGWIEMVLSKTKDRYDIIHEKSFQRLPNSSTDVFFSHPDNGFWFAKSNELYHFDKSFVRNDSLPFHTLIRNVYINNDSLLFNGTCYIDDGRGGFTIYPEQAEDTQPFIKYRYNNIEFRWAAPFFEQEDQMLFSYWLEHFNSGWSAWTPAVYKDFTNLNQGQYTMHVRAMNVYGDISLPAHYSFTIQPPWYGSLVAYFAYIILSAFIIYIIIKLYTRRLLQENIRLEGVIEERTAEIRKQKEELTDSIEYASRIQRALLPSDKLLQESEIPHFILFRPRDIVSGDFYWMGQKDGKLYIVAADCTGHGVPGAFMSMLGISFLDEIIIKSDVTDTNLILDSLREHVITSLKQSGESMETTKDGMDLAMIAVDQSTRDIQFSGAYNPLYYVRKLNRTEKAIVSRGEALELPKGAMHSNSHILFQAKGDMMPIGISEKTFEFSANELKNDNYSLYLFSDGFVDQFGGPQGKKFMSKNFKKLILEMQKYPMEKQGVEMEKILIDWMGNISQIDDILIMGILLN